MMVCSPLAPPCHAGDMRLGSMRMVFLFILLASLPYAHLAFTCAYLAFPCAHLAVFLMRFWLLLVLPCPPPFLPAFHPLPLASIPLFLILAPPPQRLPKACIGFVFSRGHCRLIDRSDKKHFVFVRALHWCRSCSYSWDNAMTSVALPLSFSYYCLTTISTSPGSHSRPGTP